MCAKHARILSLLEMSAVTPGTAGEVSVLVIQATPDTNVRNLVSLVLRLCKLHPGGILGGIPGGMSAATLGTAGEVSVLVIWDTPDTNVKNLVSLFLRLESSTQGGTQGRTQGGSQGGSQGVPFKNECSDAGECWRGTLGINVKTLVTLFFKSFLRSG